MKYFLILVVALATYFDLKSRRIPNWLTYSAFAISFIKPSYFHLVVILFSLFAAIFFGKYIGAGDIKLAAVISIWSHILNWPQIWIYVSLIAGGVFGLFKRDKAIPFAPFMGMGLLIANVARTKGFI